jgi:hypothetical protein
MHKEVPMRRAGIVLVVLLSVGVAAWLVHHYKKPAKKTGPQEWTLPAPAGQQLAADVGPGKELLPEGLRSGEASEAGTEDFPVARVGEIKVEGNGHTSQKAILDRVPLYPGKMLFYSDLKAAEANLAATGLFVVDAAKGIRPTVEVVETGDINYKNIVIRVREK